MATVSKANRPRKAPNQTRNGRARISSLSLGQLNTLIEKSTRPKDKDKIARRIRNIEKRVA
jgi:hypothetical protein